MRAIFFDFTIAFGGAPLGSISLAARLSRTMDVHIIDVFGRCEEYVRSIRSAQVPLHVLYPEGNRLFIGNHGRPLRRLLSVFSQIGDFRRIRKRLIQVLEEIGPDIVWVNNEKSLIFLLGPLLSTRFPVVLYFRGWGTRDQIRPFFRFLIKHRVASVIVHSKSIVDQLVSLGLPARKIFAAPNAVELTRSGEEARAVSPEIPGLERGLKLLLPAARPVADKGHDVAVRALRRLLDMGYDAILWIPGDIPTGVSDRFYWDLRSEISRLQLDERVHFIGWRDDLQIIIAHTDVVILPSHTEGFPRVIVEAMLLGVPVCATPVGGIPDAIIDGETGFLVSVNDDKKLAERINALDTDPELRNRIVRSAKSRAVDMFSLDKQTAAVEEIFKKTVRDGHAL
jgi:glycosyltransferase involved in cell wall biosynthesis